MKQAVEVNKSKLVDFNTLEQRFLVWQQLMKMRPLVPLKHIIPLVCAYWNGGKPAGDIVTQMEWENNFLLPVITPQTLCIKKTSLYHPLYQIHCMLQLVSAKEDLGKYSSIKSYREAANKRRSFWDTIADTDTDFY